MVVSPPQIKTEKSGLARETNSMVGFSRSFQASFEVSNV